MTSKFQQLAEDTLKVWFPNFEILQNYRPKWLKGLELDFFIPELNMAVECNGRQHYAFCPDFHKDYGEYLAQVQRDYMKMNILYKRGLHLVSLKYLSKRRTYNLMAKWIVGVLKKQSKRINLPNLPEDLKQRWDDYREDMVHWNTHSQSRYRMINSNELIGFGKKSLDNKYIIRARIECWCGREIKLYPQAKSAVVVCECGVSFGAKIPNAMKVGL